MKILLLNPPFFKKYSREQRSPAVTKSGTLYYPYWLAYATAYLEKAGHEVKLIDATPTNREGEDLFSEIRAFDPGMVVVDTSTPSIYNDVRVAERIKEELPRSFVVLVGPHVSALPRESLALSGRIDAVTVQEFDLTLAEVAERLDRGASLSGTAGLCHRIDGEIVVEAKRPYIQDLDIFPLVTPIYKRFLRIEDYFYAITRHPVVALMTGRGCPYQCTYCLYPQTLNGRNYRTMSVEQVADEFAFIAEELPQVREVFIEDDTLTLHRKRTQALCNELIRRGNKIPWTANARADVDLETLKLMKAAGCRLLCVGVESGEQEILDNVKKGIKIEQIRQFFDDTKKADIMVHGCFMVGNQGETHETLEKTLAFAKELNPDTAQFFPLMIYPGTESYAWAKEKNFIATEDFSQWVTGEGLHNSVVQRDNLSNEELVAFCNRARQEFYLRPTYLWYKMKQVFKRPAEAKRLVKSFGTFARFLIRPAERI